MMYSGKDTIAAILEKQGYKKVSISEGVLRPILVKMRLVPDRLNFIKLGNSLRTFKPDALAFLVHSLINKGEGHKYIIPNIMNFHEAKYFKEQEDINFVLIKVSADQKTRYERNLQRQDEKDVNDLARFKRLDMKNLTSTGLKELMHAKLEHVEVVNNGTINELEAKVKKVMQRFRL